MLIAADGVTIPMPRSPRRRAAVRALPPLILAFLLLASTPSAHAWVCRPDPLGLCETVQDTTGLVLDVTPSPEGVGVIVVYGLNDHANRMALNLCVRGLQVWLSSTGRCTTPPESQPPGGDAADLPILP